MSAMTFPEVRPPERVTPHTVEAARSVLDAAALLHASVVGYVDCVDTAVRNGQGHCTVESARAAYSAKLGSVAEHAMELVAAVSGLCGGTVTGPIDVVADPEVTVERSRSVLHDASLVHAMVDFGMRNVDVEVNRLLRQLSALVCDSLPEGALEGAVTRLGLHR